ncbi:Bromodomain-containing protein [Dactylonectria macrodidyma]|uniref:Bromodomain-containing protein n=1 Tax=Dactylonectria macrodidyma TaxID=307937 RepID=A0A9P9ITZ0_9HYPO|nr:Bromodomain-containing protein [Dactylonectria macrodidyma]
MSYLKDYVKASSDIVRFLTYANNYAIGGTIMQRSMLLRIRAFSKSHEIHQPPKQWKNGVTPTNPQSVNAIRTSAPTSTKCPPEPPIIVAIPTSNSKDDVTDHCDIIKEPMDLDTIEAKLEADQYMAPEDFIKGVRLVFANCRKYNHENTSYARRRKQFGEVHAAADKCNPGMATFAAVKATTPPAPHYA